MRLYAIDAPEMPGACRPGRQCTLGQPRSLASLTAGMSARCIQLNTDDSYPLGLMALWLLLAVFNIFSKSR